MFSQDKDYFLLDYKCVKEIDECENGSHQCGSASCKNTRGSYECFCGSGYIMHTSLRGSKSCADVNECSLGIHKCDQNSKCYNERGGFRWG